MNMRTFLYRSALVASLVFLAIALVVFLFGLLAWVDWKMHLEQGYAPPLISLVGILVAAIGTFSGVFFGWRSDRRQARELQLKLAELERKLVGLEDQKSGKE